MLVPSAAAGVGGWADCWKPRQCGQQALADGAEMQPGVRDCYLPAQL